MAVSRAQTLLPTPPPPPRVPVPPAGGGDEDEELVETPAPIPPRGKLSPIEGGPNAAGGRSLPGMARSLLLSRGPRRSVGGGGRTVPGQRRVAACIGVSELQHAFL